MSQFVFWISNGRKCHSRRLPNMKLNDQLTPLSRFPFYFQSLLPLFHLHRIYGSALVELLPLSPVTGAAALSCFIFSVKVRVMTCLLSLFILFYFIWVVKKNVCNMIWEKRKGVSLWFNAWSQRLGMTLITFFLPYFFLRSASRFVSNDENTLHCEGIFVPAGVGRKLQLNIYFLWLK